MPARSHAFRARWVIPVHQPPIEGGVGVVRQGRVVQLKQACDASTVVDLGNVVLMAGLINAHTHL
jgi:aminodeoxyfutalosine deaminase